MACEGGHVVDSDVVKVVARVGHVEVAHNHDPDRLRARWRDLGRNGRCAQHPESDDGKGGARDHAAILARPTGAHQ